MNALPLAAHVGKQALAGRGVDLGRVDLSILRITNPQEGSFYGLPCEREDHGPGDLPARLGRAGEGAESVIAGLTRNPWRNVDPGSSPG